MILFDRKKKLQCAKNITVTSKFVILYCGSSVSICDRNLTCLKQISNLRFVYRGYVSPDEKNILLVSNANHIYVVSLNTFSVISNYTIPSPYNYGLEGRACWCTSDSFLLPIQNSKTMLSAIRKMGFSSTPVCEDLFKEKYWIVYIALVKCRNQHLFIGLDRIDQSWNLVWFSSESDYKVYRILDFDEAIFDVEILSDAENIVLTGETKIHCCKFNGFPSEFPQIYPKNIVEDFGFPTFLRHSKQKPNVSYLGLQRGLIVWNEQKKAIIKYYSIEYGARSVEELDNLLLILTYNGVELLSLTDFTPI